MTKSDIFNWYHKMTENPQDYDNGLHNDFFLIIALNGWMEEYNETYPNEFGL